MADELGLGGTEGSRQCGDYYRKTTDGRSSSKHSSRSMNRLLNTLEEGVHSGNVSFDRDFLYDR
jgi:hypothetical protein